MKLSVLTATYNRGIFLNRIYDSILENLKYGMEVEWIVIDDGSIDNTFNIVNNFKLKKGLSIKYIYEENSGKMCAINKGTDLATGDLLIDCDSDDFFTCDAFNIINDYACKLLDNPSLYALCFLKVDTNNNISGKKFKKNEFVSTMFDLYFKDDIMGEKILVFNAKIRKLFKHELEKEEKFITEARMYHKMDDLYKILCVNLPVEVGDYMEGGYTANVRKTFLSCPNGYYSYFKEILQKDLSGVSLKKRLYIFKHFCLFWVLRFLSFPTFFQF